MSVVAVLFKGVFMAITRHFMERMIERQVSESEILKTLQSPDMISDSKHGGRKKIYQRKSIFVVIDEDERTLITVWRR